jgi:hypothetical protein
MLESGILTLVLAALISVVVAFLFYGCNSKLNPRLRWFFGILRFLTVFVLILLLFNPKFYQNTYFDVKPTLAIAVDNSQSVSYLERVEEVNEFIDFIQNSEALNNRFDVSFYSFGNELSRMDSLNFDELQTNISHPLQSLNEIYKNSTAPIILVTDGNQTLGTDYEFTAQNSQQPVYSIILGDTIVYKDLAINQINVNRYAYLRNEFPVEVFLSYTGDEIENSVFTVRQGNSTLHQENVTFSDRENSKVLNFNLPANQVGVQRFTAEIRPLENEKNTENNTRFFAVEVIDQATNVLLVSDIVHPDQGAFKKSITSNEQRKFEMDTPENAVNRLDDFQLVILYQPSNRFSGVIDKLEETNQNTLWVFGPSTNWMFLNGKQTTFGKQAYSREQVQGHLNQSYGQFSVEDIGFGNLPPMESTLGDLKINVPHDVMLYQRVIGIFTENPLLATFEENNRRHAILDAEGIWRWRANVYVRNNSFKPFDDFMSSLVQYLSSNQRKSRLEVKSESFYYNSGDVKISAQYFDRNYIFNNSASLTISLKNQETEQQYTFPLLLKTNFYEVNLSSLPAGDYTYTVSVVDEALSSSGNFSIIEFNVERQFLNANADKLKRVSNSTGGKSYFASNFSDIENELLTNNSYATVQKSEQKTVTLLDWKTLLFLLVILLAAEWFSRKYNGLI